MGPKTLVVVASLLAHVVTASFEVYAYGQTNDYAISQQKVFYADGVAYVGDRPPVNMSTVANVSFSLVEENTSTATYSLMVSSANATETNATVTGAMFALNTTAGADDEVRFVNGDQTDLTTTGFRMYGRNIMYQAADRSLQSNFYLSPTSDASVWALRWTTDFDSSNNETAVPVALRTIGNSN